MQNDQWKTAREIAARAKKETRQQLIESGISAGTASMAPRAVKRKNKYKLQGWPYLSVCATLPVPDTLFQDFCETMNVTKDTAVRQVKNRVTAYLKAMPDPVTNIDKSGLDYIVIDGRTFWIPPECSQMILGIVQEYVNND